MLVALVVLTSLAVLFVLPPLFLALALRVISSPCLPRRMQRKAVRRLTLSGSSPTVSP